MRSRSNAIARRPHLKQPAAESVGLEVVREFIPDQTGLDDLAQAIRVLLGDGTAPQPHLLSPAHRGSHVVGASDAP